MQNGRMPKWGCAKIPAEAPFCSVCLLTTMPALLPPPMWTLPEAGSATTTFLSIMSVVEFEVFFFGVITICSPGDYTYVHKKHYLQIAVVPSTLWHNNGGRGAWRTFETVTFPGMYYYMHASAKEPFLNEMRPSRKMNQHFQPQPFPVRAAYHWTNFLSDPHASDLFIVIRDAGATMSLTMQKNCKAIHVAYVHILLLERQQVTSAQYRCIA